MIAGHHAMLHGYRLLEYVEFTGTQIVDLGFVFTPRDRIEADWQFTQVASRQQRVFCQRPNPGLHTELYINGSGNIGFAYERDNLNGWKSNASAMNTNRVTYGINGPTKRMFRGNTTWAIADLSSMSDSDCGTEHIMLGREFATTPTYARCFGVVAWKSNSMIRDLRPAIDAEGFACLFDIVSEKFFRSVTSTPLVAGPNK